DMAVGIVAAEILQPIVIDPEHLRRRLVVLQLGGGAEDAEDHLGVHAVAVHVLGAEMRVADPADVLLAVGKEAGLGHDVDAAVLPRYQLGAARADAVLEAKIGPILRHPHRPVGAVGDVRHTLLQFARRLRREKVGRHPRHVEMAVSRNPVVAHGNFPSCVSPPSAWFALGYSFNPQPAAGKRPGARGQNTMLVRTPNTASLPTRLAGSFGLGMPPLGVKKYWKSGCTVSQGAAWYW